MAWVKTSDNAHGHPRVAALRDAPKADRRTKWEVYGFVHALAELSAAHLTDGRINRDTVETLGGTRWSVLVAQAVHAGILTEHIDKKTGARSWQLVDDPNWVHIRPAAEIEWERQRRADASNTALTVPVRLKWGDQCAYCGIIVNWQDRRGPRRGTYDHRVPGQPATVETYVPACFACNRGRSDSENADLVFPLRPPPNEPFYSEQTAKWLVNHGHPVRASAGIQQKPGRKRSSVPGTGRDGTGRVADQGGTPPDLSVSPASHQPAQEGAPG
ncbi:hypothetical protein ACI3EY_03660 [Ornithinimicrobium sp. LYQ92]|uniref:hypothetical protein n=1 Tax=Serinicoccus sp. LYQ92 TaxID=3378798 RepID=UPI003853CEDB